MEHDPTSSSVWSGCFGPKPQTVAIEGKHMRSNSKTSLSLSRWWNASSPHNEDGDTVQGDEALASDQDRMLAQLADDLLGLDSSSDPSKSAFTPAPLQSGPTHERKLSWPFSGGRRVLPQPTAGQDEASAEQLSVDLASLPSSEATDSPFSVSSKDVSGMSGVVGEEGELADTTARPQGYRRLWQSITSVRKGDRVATPTPAAPTQEYTVDSLSRGVLALKASQPIMEAARLDAGLRALDSRAVAALLKELAKSGAPQRASELFDYLRSVPESDDLSALADLYTYTTVISQCGAHHHLRKALELVAEMRSRGIQCNIHTYSALMSVCVKCNECELALDVYEQLQAEGCTPNLVTYNILIDAYSRTGQWARAVEVLDPVARQGLVPEARTYNAIISACGKAGQPAAALRVYDRMLTDGVEPTSTTYTSIISALGRAGLVDEAVKVYRDMGTRGCEANVITYSSLISVCERGGRAELALQLFADMQAAGVRPNVVTYNGVVATCAHAGLWQRAAQLVDSMASNGCRPDAATYSALVAAYERAGQWQSALVAFEKAHSAGLRPDVGAYNCVLGALWSSGRLPAQVKAIQLLAAAQRQGALRLQTLSASEASATAYTPGALSLITLNWLATFRDGLTAAAALAANTTLRSLLLVRGKQAAPGHSYDTACEALNATFAVFSVPANAAITQHGLLIKADSRQLPAWAASASGLALLSIFDYAGLVAALPTGHIIKDDRIAGGQCAKAFAAVQEFERVRGEGVGADVDPETLCSGPAAALRQDVIACITALSSGMQLREETAHDAVQLCDRMLMLTEAPTSLPPAPACAAALILLACRQAGQAATVLRQGQLVLQAAGLPLSAVLEAEQRVLHALGAAHGAAAAISPLRVLHLFLERMGCDSGTMPKCQMVHVMGLSASDMIAKAAISPSFVRFDPSIVAAGCLIKARQSMGLAPAWPLVLQDMTGHDGASPQELVECMELLEILGVSS